MTVRSNAAPNLTLLSELEPRHRVFFRNLADSLFRRSEPPLYLSSKPARFWGDVFVYSGIPWMWILESCLLHVMVMTLWILLQTVAVQHHPLLRKDLFRSHITYYPPSFPAKESRPPSLPVVRPARKEAPAQGQRLRVPREQRNSHSITTPPDLKMATAQPPNLGNPAAVAPPIPLAATKSSRLALPAGPGAIVAPPPDIGQRSSRGFGLPQSSVVAPSPDTQGISGRRSVNGLQSSVVAPPPAIPTSARRIGDVNIGHSDVVAPAPQLPMHEQRTLPGSAGSSVTNTAGSVVGPPPSVRDAGNLSNTRAGSLTNAPAQVVPPPPLLDSGKNPPGNSRAGGLAGPGDQAVPPPVSMQAGTGAGSTRSRAIAAAGVPAVAPPSAAKTGTGTTGGSAQPGAGVSHGNAAVSATNGGAAPGGNANAANAGAGLPGGLLPGEIPTTGNGAAGQGTGAGTGTDSDTLAGDARSAVGVPQNPQQANDNTRATQELPLRLISAALTLPSSSYFSNYEVYIAEMRLRKAQTQLIKLVYMSLPYQRRLTEYLQGGSRVYKLRVTRDPSCDETLMQMTWPEFDGAPAAHDKESNAKLPCYRTSADDYRNAMEHTRQPSDKRQKK